MFPGMSASAGFAPVMGPLEWGLLVLLSIFWGGSFFFIAVILTDLGPLSLVAARVGLAALVLLAYLRWRGLALPADGPTWLAFFVMGAINNALPFTLISLSQTRIDSSLAAILNATTPLFTVLLAHWLTRDERLTASRLVGVVTGLAGAIVLIGPAALAGLGADALAQFAMLGATLSYACAGIFGRRFRALPPAIPAFGMTAGAFVMMLPVSLAVERPWTMPAPGFAAMAALAGLAIVSTAAGYILYFRILATAGATNLLLVTFLLPVTALLLGTTILGERPDGTALVGMILILLGLAAIDGRLFRRRQALSSAGAPFRGEARDPRPAPGRPRSSTGP